MLLKGKHELTLLNKFRLSDGQRASCALLDLNGLVQKTNQGRKNKPHTYITLDPFFKSKFIIKLGA